METNAKHLVLALIAASFLTLPSFGQANREAPVGPPPRSSETPVPPSADQTPPPPGSRRSLFRRDDPRRNGPGRFSGPRQFDRKGPGRMALDRRAGREGNGLVSLSTVSGTVGQWQNNDDYVLDGFTLNSNNGPATVVTFLPHMGQRVQQAIKTGSTVSVTGYANNGPDGHSRFHMTSLTAGKTTITNEPPTVLTSPPVSISTTTVTGKITDYRLGRDGRVNGFVVGENTIVRIPPHVAYQLTNLATKGTEISVQGYTRKPMEGQVQVQRATIMRASIVTINGQQYLVR